MLVCLATLLISWSFGAGAQITIIPAAPKRQDVVRVQMPITEAVLKANVSMVANRITVAIETPASDFVLPPARPPLDVVLGQLPAGEYQVEILRHFRGFTQTVSFGTATFVVAEQSSTDPIFGRTDLWWNPNESGWGINVIQHPSGLIFATWYTYDPDGTPAWYVVPTGRWATDSDGSLSTRYTGPIYRTSGPPVTETFDPSRVTRTLVGEAEFIFAGWDFLSVKLTVDGKTITRQLQRQGF
jgi:hypothetical protein